MGMKVQGDQTPIRATGEQGGNSTEQKPVQVQVNIGSELLKLGQTTYGTGNVGIQGNINLGKEYSLIPSANVGLGQDLSTFNPELNLSKQITPQVSVQAGVGYRQASFPKQTTVTEIPFAEGEGAYEMDGKVELQDKGTYHAYGTETFTRTTKTGQNEVYGTVGTTYKPNGKFSFTGAVELGSKHTNGEKTRTVRDETRETCTQGGEWKEIPPVEPDEPPIPYFDSSSVRTEVTNTLTVTETSNNKTAFNANVKVGAEYNINPHLSAGVTANIGLNNNSDNFLGAKVAYKF